VVPRQAIRKDGAQDVVFVVAGDTVERRAVKTGQASGDDVEIVTGLAMGERVVVEGPPDLAAGRPVVVRGT
jgi:multidrug efflux pump subunit AcrA (membrane-fusion protein)